MPLVLTFEKAVYGSWDEEAEIVRLSHNPKEGVPFYSSNQKIYLPECVYDSCVKSGLSFKITKDNPKRWENFMARYSEIEDRDFNPTDAVAMAYSEMEEEQKMQKTIDKMGITALRNEVVRLNIDYE